LEDVGYRYSTDENLVWDIRRIPEQPVRLKRMMLF